ncbi:hypothetical protein B296_00047378 [Ensete ventricosum]|uniref:Uncharacterized protein n=1 Tax=Ensete ventricosum TaxID=4639 RepID=A0A426YKS3_ENSVE|nr:hypothetical protein B296_00047378 [Ensete ventricosum]
MCSYQSTLRRLAMVMIKRGMRRRKKITRRTRKRRKIRAREAPKKVWSDQRKGEERVSSQRQSNLGACDRCHRRGWGVGLLLDAGKVALSTSMRLTLMADSSGMKSIRRSRSSSWGLREIPRTGPRRTRRVRHLLEDLLVGVMSQ